MNVLRSPLMRQLALIISCLILFVEGALLLFSLNHEKKELQSIKENLEVRLVKETGKTLQEIYPGFLNEEDIQKRMTGYTVNILSLTLLISFLVSLGTMVIFYRKAGRHIVKIQELNIVRAKKGSKSPRYRPEDFPQNEIGELINSRNLMLDEIESYEKDLQSKLNEAQEKLIQSAKLSMVGEFTSGIIHDIRNPLTVILSYTGRILDPNKREKLGPEKVTSSLQKINLAGSKLHRLVDRMGRFNRIDNDYQKDISLAGIIENSLLFTQSKAEGLDIAIEKEILPNASIFGDENALEQVFSNLFSNAYDAMETRDKKKLTVTMEESEDYFIVHIQDTGKGIPLELLPNIYDSFYTTKDKGKGTGLGLSSVQEIILAHGGEIVLESVEDQGTTFSIFLYKEDHRRVDEEESADDMVA